MTVQIKPSSASTCNIIKGGSSTIIMGDKKSATVRRVSKSGPVYPR